MRMTWAPRRPGAHGLHGAPRGVRALPGPAAGQPGAVRGAAGGAGGRQRILRRPAWRPRVRAAACGRRAAHAACACHAGGARRRHGCRRHQGAAPRACWMHLQGAPRCLTCLTRAAACRAQGLGLQYARHLADAGARCLVLTSRAPRLSAEELAALARPGAAAFVVAADAGDAAHTARVAAWAREALPAVAHYAHAAGVSGHAPLVDMTAAQLGAVLGPKVSRAGMQRGRAGARWRSAGTHGPPLIVWKVWMCGNGDARRCARDGARCACAASPHLLGSRGMLRMRSLGARLFQLCQGWLPAQPDEIHTYGWQRAAQSASPVDPSLQASKQPCAARTGDRRSGLPCGGRARA